MLSVQFRRDLEVRRTCKVVKLLSQLHKMREFANLNYTAVYKIFKKHDKKAPAEISLLPRLEKMGEKGGPNLNCSILSITLAK